MESVIQSPVCEASYGSEAYTSWQHPFCGTQIRLHHAALRHLSDEALRRIKATPASEIGGILWGRMLIGSVVIEDAEFISSKDPFFNTTRLDARNLEEAVECSRADGLELIGYFRSHIRDGLCLSPQDQAFANKCLRNPEHLLLLIRPFEMGICVGAFFFWRGGELQTDSSDLEIPFLALEHQPVVQLETITAPVEDDRSAATPIARPDPVTPTTPVNPVPHLSSERRVLEPPRPQSARSSTKRSRFALIGTACAIVIVAIALAAIYWAFPLLRERAVEKIQPVATSPEVGLKVTRAPDGQLDLTWNRPALERARAEQAVLTITDGPISKQLAIDGAQLHSGTLTYFPSGSDIQFRIEITLNPGHSIAESVRVILPSGIAAEASARSLVVNAISQHVPGSEKPAVAALNIPSTPPPISAPTPFKPSAYLPSREVRGYQISGHPLAPDLKLDPAMTYATLPSSISALPSPPPRLPVQLLTTASARTGSPPKRALTKPASPVTQVTHTLTAYVPPRPIRQVMPDVKLAGYALAAQAGKVEVQVTIDEEGYVTEARTVLSVTGTNGLIANAAIAAARQWIFRPATLRGKAVVAEHRIVFDFERQ